MATKTSGGFTAEEKAAMKATAKERKAQETREEGERAVREALSGMNETDRALGERLHAIITENAPALLPRTWYGMPAYANQDGKVLCFSRNAAKFNERYATLGFNDVARLDDGTMWPNGFALTEITAADEQRIAALMKQAVS
ncbi:MAG: DUF1801 domain-containing protein [Thermomicrobiales bacterium]